MSMKGDHKHNSQLADMEPFKCTSNGFMTELDLKWKDDYVWWEGVCCKISYE